MSLVQGLLAVRCEGGGIIQRGERASSQLPTHNNTLKPSIVTRSLDLLVARGDIAVGSREYFLTPIHPHHPRYTSTMSTQHTAKPTGPLAPQYVTGVYIPSAILIVGTAAFKLQWLPLALAVAAALGGYQFFNNRTIPTVP